MQTLASRRDLRLDFFRGLALWFIFIDHVPSSIVANVTFRNFGFSDATEIFVYISGYTAAIVYGASLRRNGFVRMAFQVLKRCWQLYAAHILLFVFFIAQITWVSIRFDNASFIEELNIMQFHAQPQESIIRALILHYRPVNLDVLPLYMALLAGLAAVPVADGALAAADPAGGGGPLGPRAAIAMGVPRLRERRHLAFQPARLAAAVRDRRDSRLGPRRGRPVAALAPLAGLAGGCLAAVLPLHHPQLEVPAAQRLGRSGGRALALSRSTRATSASPGCCISWRWPTWSCGCVPENAPMLNWPLAHPIIRCGQHSPVHFLRQHLACPLSPTSCWFSSDAAS